MVAPGPPVTVPCTPNRHTTRASDRPSSIASENSLAAGSAKPVRPGTAREKSTRPTTTSGAVTSEATSAGVGNAAGPARAMPGTARWASAPQPQTASAAANQRR